MIGGAGALAMAGLAALGARPARASAAETDAAIKKLVGNAPIKEGKVTLKLPQIAENGNTVPFSVVVDSPMTEKDHVKAIHVFADGNPAPGVASFSLTPRSGKAEISMRMRLAQTQDIRAIAVMSDGQVFMAKQEIKVTIGGCGG
ncbi:MAG: thiosulfate oxidation carrier protein SoxY [Rhodospirillales bacterium]|nr:thiosulfate oxidation carrier protein SoxY [Rhodospirillales bacterium]